MSLQWGPVAQAGLEPCLALDPASTGDSIVGRAATLTLWRALLHSLSFNSAVIRYEHAGRSAIVSFGASVFLDPRFAAEELRQPAPEINSRFFAAMHAGRPALQPSDAIAPGAAPQPLDLLLLCSSFRPDALAQPEQQEAVMLLPRTLLHLHTGYPIARILMETTSEQIRLLALSSGIWQMHAHFPARQRALLIATRQQGLGQAAFNILSPLFRCELPRLALRDPEKELLCHAMHGETDTELAALLGLSLSAVKKRWSTLFTRIAGVLPQLLPGHAAEPEHDHRGLQKRQHILTYVRDHPEELRPYRWFPGTSHTAA